MKLLTCTIRKYLYQALLGVWGVNNAFNSEASSGFILPPSINRNCLLRKAPSNNFFSSSVSGINWGTGLGCSLGSSATNV